ncbi:unnamed protein product [Protopolystoma xenopodis]|uniref:Uncharacterized protein n=1 Tax=Protopolystoma xenopodis TaxID=117903 RepID=A0A3S5AV15_9PLAT|nr:unnamed protein product [Protopolystoma xenopodis]
MQPRLEFPLGETLDCGVDVANHSYSDGNGEVCDFDFATSDSLGRAEQVPITHQAHHSGNFLSQWHQADRLCLIDGAPPLRMQMDRFSASDRRVEGAMDSRGRGECGGDTEGDVMEENEQADDDDDERGRQADRSHNVTGLQARRSMLQPNQPSDHSLHHYGQHQVWPAFELEGTGENMPSLPARQRRRLPRSGGPCAYKISKSEQRFSERPAGMYYPF